MKEQLTDQEEEMLNRMIETERENDLFLAAGTFRFLRAWREWLRRPLRSMRKKKRSREGK
jgi:hypothetical protein